MPWVLRKKGGDTVTIDREVSIGRDPTCTIRVQAPAVSRVHCRLQPADDYVILTDEGRNGTLVNGIRVGKVAHVRGGDVIEVDTESFQIQRVIPPVNETQDLGFFAKKVPAPTQGEGEQEKPVQAAAPAAPAAAFAPTPNPVVLPPTVYPPPPPAAPLLANEPTAPTAEVSVARLREQHGVSFEVEVVEDVSTVSIRYRDAVRLADEQALLIMTDFVGVSPSPNLTPELTAKWKGVVRKAGAKGNGPDAVLQILNRELVEANLQATATCARLDVRERLITVACAGATPSFILRSGNRVVRVQSSPNVALGRVKAAQFTDRSLHFDRGDTLLVPSAAFVAPLETILSQPFALNNLRAAEWLRQHRVQPPGGSLLCLTLR